jgi:hypothetical protein
MEIVGGTVFDKLVLIEEYHPLTFIFTFPFIFTVFIAKIKCVSC